MRLLNVAVIALAAATPLGAQTVSDLGTATPVAGIWTYASVSDGSDAAFAGTGTVQLSIHCTRATRRVRIAKPATMATPSLVIWTSGQTRSVAASFDPATGRLTAEFGAYDGLLDNLANSRGRIGFTAGTEPPLVLPAWPEIARVIEDCRV